MKIAFDSLQKKVNSIRDGIANGSINPQAEIRGPKVKKQPWNLNIRGGRKEYLGHIHRAAYHYYYKNIIGLRRPQQNGLFRTQLKIRAHFRNSGFMPR